MRNKDNYILKPVFYIIFIIFTYFPSLNGSRQALAAAVVFFASKYILERKFWVFFIWVLVAISFHYSSVVLLLLYFVVTKEFNRITMLTILFLSFFLSQIGFFSFILEYILLNYGFLDIGGYIENYLYSSYNSREIEFGIVFYINTFILILFIILKKRLIINEKMEVTFNFFYLYILTYILSMDAPMLTRLTYFFSIYMAICIPAFGQLFKSEDKKLVNYILIMLYSILFLFVLMNGYLNPSQLDYVPYNYNFNIIK